MPEHLVEDVIAAVRRAIRAEDAREKAADRMSYPSAYRLQWENEEVDAATKAVDEALMRYIADAVSEIRDRERVERAMDE